MRIVYLILLLFFCSSALFFYGVHIGKISTERKYLKNSQINQQNGLKEEKKAKEIFGEKKTEFKYLGVLCGE